MGIEILKYRGHTVVSINLGENLRIIGTHWGVNLFIYQWAN